MLLLSLLGGVGVFSRLDGVLALDENDRLALDGCSSNALGLRMPSFTENPYNFFISKIESYFFVNSVKKSTSFFHFCIQISGKTFLFETQASLDLF